MEDNSAKRKRTNDEMEEVSYWVDEAEKVFCSTLSDICEFDFICLLPDCAVYRLLSYLDTKTLLIACQVNKGWNSIISNNQRLWRNVCSRNGFLVPAEPSVEQLADASYSKRLYLKNTVLVERLTKELPGETISLKGHTDHVTSMFFYNGKLATASRDCTVRIWSCTTGDCLANYSVHSDCVHDVKFDDNFIVTASEDRTAACSDVSNGTRLQTFVHTETVICLDFNTAIDVLVTGSDDFDVKIWSFTDGNLLRTLEFKPQDTGDDMEDFVSPIRMMKIWGTQDCFFHVLVCGEITVIDYEIGLSMTVVEKKCVIESDNSYLSGFKVDDSSLKVWAVEGDDSDSESDSSALTTVTETSFECVNSCGRSLLTKGPIARNICPPYSNNSTVGFLAGGACFDVFVVRGNANCKKGWLYVTGNQSEMRHFTINLPESALYDFFHGLCICEAQWLNGISEESLCDRTLVAVNTEGNNVELLKLKPLK